MGESPEKKETEIEKNEKKAEMHTCKECKKKFTLKNNLARHIKLHHGKKVANYVCSNCGRTTTTPYNMVLHFLSSHDETINSSDAKKMNTPTSNTKKGM